MSLKSRLFYLLFSTFLFIQYISFAQTSEVFIDFQKQKEWKMYGNAAISSKFYSSMEKGPDAVTTFVGKIDYGFLTPANDYIEVVSPLPIPGFIKKIRMWIYGDKKASLLKMVFKDSKEEMFVSTLAKINWYGWKQIEIDFGFVEFYGGDNNGIMDKPIQFYSFLLEDDPNDQVISGTILLKDLEFIYEKAPVKEEVEVKVSPDEKEPIEKRKGVFFSGLASMTFDDVDTDGSTNVNQYKEEIIRKSLLHQYFDLIIKGQLYDQASVQAKIRIEKGELGWAADRKEDYYNENYNKSGFELEKMEIKGKIFGFNNTLVIGKINPYFSSYSLSKILYGVQWDFTKAGFKSTIVGARPESTITDRYGLYANNDDYNVYLLGIRESYQIGVLTLAGSLVNIHQNNGMFSAPKNFLRGNREVSPAMVYLKMGDNSPETTGGGDLFNLQFKENGVETYSFNFDDLGISEKKFLIEVNHGYIGSDTGIADNGPGESYRYTKFDTYVIYGVPLAVNSKSIEIIMEVQNNYCFEISIDGGVNWMPVLLSPVDVDDKSNRGIVKIRVNQDSSIEVDYGSGYVHSNHTLNISDSQYKKTGKTILGFDISGSFLDTDIYFEYNTIYEHRIYSDGSRKDMNIGYAAYLNLSRKIEWVYLKGQIFDITRNYDTAFKDINTVDDNDDQDEWPDNWEGEIVRFIDENKNGIPDNEERPPYQKVGLYIIDDYFNSIIDQNHNDVRDDREDDDLPDYKYKINQFGYHIESTLTLLKYIEFKLGYKEAKVKRGKAHNEEILLGMIYNRSLRNKGKLTFIHETKKVSDTIHDNLVFYNDPLYYRNNLLNISTLFIDYKLIKYIDLKSKLQYFNNKSLRYNRMIQNTESVIKLSKSIPLIYEFSLTPILFSRCNKDISKAHFPVIVYQKQTDKNVFDIRSILELAYHLSQNSKAFIAGQYGAYKHFQLKDFKYKITSFVIGAEGYDINSFQYGVEYKREKYDYDSKTIKDGLVSSFYAHVSYKF